MSFRFPFGDINWVVVVAVVEDGVIREVGEREVEDDESGGSAEEDAEDGVRK